jgi:hypothetical protein
MGTIYQIVGDIKALSSLIEGLEDEETGEIRDLSDEEKETFAAWVKEETEAFDHKFDRICQYYQSLREKAEVCEAERSAHKVEMDRLSRRAKAKENAAKRVKDLLFYAFDALGKKKHETALFSAGIQNTASSVRTSSVFNVDDIPKEYLKPSELSSSAIASGIKSGKLIIKPVSTKKEDLESGAFVSPVEEGQVFTDQGEKLAGVFYLPGKNLVIR